MAWRRGEEGADAPAGALVVAETILMIQAALSSRKGTKGRNRGG
jgi:hypothetical protein